MINYVNILMQMKFKLSYFRKLKNGPPMETAYYIEYLSANTIKDVHSYAAMSADNFGEIFKKSNEFIFSTKCSELWIEQIIFKHV